MTLNAALLLTCVITLNALSFQANYPKQVEVEPILSAKNSPKIYLLATYHLWRYFKTDSLIFHYWSCTTLLGYLSNTFFDNKETERAFVLIERNQVVCEINQL